MSHQVRIGSQIEPGDPFWVQVREAVSRQAQQMAVDLVPLELSRHPFSLSNDERAALLEEVLAQDLHALIVQSLPPDLLHSLLQAGLAIVGLDETPLDHPLFASICGLYDAGVMIGTFLAQQLGGRGRVLSVGGLVELGQEDGSTRLAGLRHAVAPYPAIHLHHVPTAWNYEQARHQSRAALANWPTPIDAIFGLSDSVALAARDVAAELDLLAPHTLVAGVNGDPLALAAITEGTMSVTVETSAAHMGADAVQLAYQAARGEALPRQFPFHLRLVTQDNVVQVTMDKLIALADLPSRLVGVNRRLEHQRLTQLEVSAAINRRVGALLDRRRLSQEIADLIRVNYGYEEVQLFLWSDPDQMLTLDYPTPAPGQRGRIPLAEAHLLGEALTRGKPIFIPDAQHSPRFAPDPQWSATRSRVVLPIRLGAEKLGVLDLHSHSHTTHLRQELIGLQSLADQLGIAMRNAELYAAAVQAQAAAERADHLKTRLLANVSHELRAPLNVILGYSQAVLTGLEFPDRASPDQLRRDVGHVYRSGEHLLRLINDLLDLSRAEIDALDIFPESIALRPFLADVFQSMAPSGDDAHSVTWRLRLPARLPIIEADPVRLRQILINLLSNARKFTIAGEVALGAEVEPPYLHLWVSDTGPGIPIDLQERIFEPFVTAEYERRRSEGVGLGLAITRRLVAAHHGNLTLESQPGQGSAFHVYLPLPNLAGRAPLSPPGTGRAALLLISTSSEPSEAVAQLARRQRLQVCRVQPDDDVSLILAGAQPVALAWDIADAEPRHWALVERLRAHPQVCQLPFILYSPEGEDAVGVTNVLTKPIDGSRLVDTIRALLPPSVASSLLVVDDDPDARHLYRRLLSQAAPGVSVREAENGVAALAALAETTPSLVILDLAMPEVNGFTVLEAMRSNAKTRHVPVLILSGRVLTFEDVRRLDYPRVILQSKHILADDEALSLIQRALGGEPTLPQSTSALVKRALAYLHQYYTTPLTRAEIARAVGVSENYLSQIFRNELGVSPWDYLSRWRVQRARELLATTDKSITAVAAEVGFDDSAYFSRVFRKHAGESPQAYRHHLA